MTYSVAKLRSARISSQKARLVANQIRGKDVEEAIGILTFAPQKSAHIIKKVLEDKARFEREERIRKQQEALKTKSFHALQGQLPWPAGGRIISKFGKQWNPKLKTTTENPGIDIKG